MAHEENSKPDILKNHYMSCYGVEIIFPDRMFIERLTGGCEPETQAGMRRMLLLEKKEAGIKLKHGIYVLLLMILSIALILTGTGFLVYLVQNELLSILIGYMAAQLMFLSYLFWTDLFDL